MMRTLVKLLSLFHFNALSFLLFFKNLSTKGQDSYSVLVESRDYQKFKLFSELNKIARLIIVSET